MGLVIHTTPLFQLLKEAPIQHAHFHTNLFFVWKDSKEDFVASGSRGQLRPFSIPYCFFAVLSMTVLCFFLRTIARCVFGNCNFGVLSLKIY